MSVVLRRSVFSVMTTPSLAMLQTVACPRSTRISSPSLFSLSGVPSGNDVTKLIRVSKWAILRPGTNKKYDERIILKQRRPTFVHPAVTPMIKTT